MSNLSYNETLRPTIGIVQIRPHLYNFLLTNENISLSSENPVLDLCRNTLIARELRSLARTADELRNLDVNKQLFSKKLRFILAINDTEPERIYFDSQATNQFNNFLHYYMIECLHRHVSFFVEMKLGKAKDGYLDFIRKNGLEESDADWESLKKAEFRLRKEKNISNY